MHIYESVRRKSFWVSVVIAVVCAFLAGVCGFSLFAATGESAITAEGVPSVAAVIFDEDGSGAGLPLATASSSFADMWNYAASLPTSKDYPATVELIQDVISTNGSLGSGIGFGDGTASGKNYLYVKEGSYIVLDLAGRTLSRGLTTSTPNGCVIKVYGTLTIMDSGKYSDNIGTITGGHNNGNEGACICVYGGTLNICGGQISGNKTLGYGGGVYLKNGATLNMTAGKITGNEAMDGGGVVAMLSDVGSNININGGEISNNTTISTCGGVLVFPSCTFNMSGSAKICGNSGKYNVGGVALYGTFNMSGGEIYGNYSGNGESATGGGVCLCDNGKFNMSGGRIYGNSANIGGGGVVFGYNSNPTINVSGSAVIENNYIGGSKADGSDVYTGGTLNNVQLSANKVINVSDGRTLTESDIFTGSIGVTTATAPIAGSPVAITSCWTSSGTAEATDKGTFLSDNTSYTVGTSAGGERTLNIYYAVSYDKGTYGAEDSFAGVKIDGESLTLPGAVFTRAGYTQTGWSTSDGGAKAYEVDGAYTTEAVETFYPVWTANKDMAYTVEHYFEDVFGEYVIDANKTQHLNGEIATTVSANYYSGDDLDIKYEAYVGHESKVESGVISGDGTLTLKLYYKYRRFTVSWYTDGGSLLKQKTDYKYGDQPDGRRNSCLCCCC